MNGYALTFASLMLLAGSISNHVSRRRVMPIGLSIFVAGSLLAALATSPDLLIAGRVITGIGVAASEPGTLSLIRHLYPREDERARALGAWAAVSGLALARCVLVQCRAAGFVIVVLASMVVPESADPQANRLDIPGFFAGSIGIGALTFAIILGETSGYRATNVVALSSSALLHSRVSFASSVGAVHRCSISPIFLATVHRGNCRRFPTLLRAIVIGKNSSAMRSGE